MIKTVEGKETAAELWLGLQKDYELDLATDEVGELIEREVRTLASIEAK